MDRTCPSHDRLMSIERVAARSGLVAR